MRNTYFNLPTFNTEDGFTVKDIIATNKYKKLSDEFLAENNKYWYYKNIHDDSRLELIAYTEYQDSSLWDILFIINQMDNVWDLPKSGDYINTISEQKVKKFNELFGASRMNETLTFRTQQIYDQYFELNEKHRRFRFIYSEYIPNFLEQIKAIK